MVDEQNLKKNISDECGETEYISANQKDYTGTYLFISFDLVNSTYFKNKEKDWGQVFEFFFEFCKDNIYEQFNNIKLWKMIGDEILFYHPILSENHLYQVPEKIYNILDLSICSLHSKYNSTKGILSVKASMWAAATFDNISDVKVKFSNRIIKEQTPTGTNLDFLGPDIDIGFRISKYALQKKLVIDAKLACLLTKLETELNKNNIAENMRIVSYQQLKGVWDNRHYPIIWYQNTKWTDIGDIFLYDEKFNNEIACEVIKSNGQSLDDVSKLTKIFLELNKIDEVENLRKGIQIYSQNNPEGILVKTIPYDKLCETHLVAICVNDNNEILIAKRTQKDDLSEKWEFGCSQVRLNETFEEALKRGYKNDFNIDLQFYNNTPTPIGIYNFSKSKENNRKVPGIIFVAKININEIEEQKIDKTKHTMTKWIDKNNYKEIKENESVQDFHKRIEDTYKFLENIPYNNK